MTGPPAGRDPGRPIAIVNARLFAMSGAEEQSNATLLIVDGKIRSIARDLAPPADWHVIDAAGAIVTPGLMNGASHLGLVEISSLLDGAGSRQELPGSDVQYGLDPSSTLLPLARADGLTRAGVFPPRSDGRLIAGTAAVLRLSEGPDILDRPHAGVFVSLGDVGANAPATPSGVQWLRLRRILATAKEGATRAQDTGAARNAQADEDSEVLDRVISGDAPLMMQVGREGDIRRTMALRRDFNVRVVVFGGAEAWRVAGDLAHDDIPVVLNPFDNLPSSFDAMGARLDNAAILQSAGVRIAFSAPGIHLSHNAGAALREAAGLAVANGLPWIDALAAITVNPAAIWGIADHYGALAAGADADIVVWDGDPLEPASSARTVLVRRVVDSGVTRQSRLRDRYHPKHRQNPWPPAFR